MVRLGRLDPLVSETHDLLVNTYYVAASSILIPGVPTLRRKMLTVAVKVSARIIARALRQTGEEK